MDEQPYVTQQKREERLAALTEVRTMRDGRTTLDNVHALRRKVILDALFNVPACKDSTEYGRACRHCEATAVAEALENLEVPG